MNTNTVEPTSSIVDWTADDSTKTPVVPDEFGTGADGLKTIFTRMSSLWREPDDDEYFPPTRAAFDRAIEYLEQTGHAMMQLHGAFPVGYVATDDRGGIRVEWWHEQNQCVHLVVNHDSRSKDYTFVKLTDEDGVIERRVLPSRLAVRLAEIESLRRHG